jgi:hypothetical protein
MINNNSSRSVFMINNSTVVKDQFSKSINTTDNIMSDINDENCSLTLD